MTVWDGRISPVFDVCREALILTVDGGAVVARASEIVALSAPPLKIERLVQLGVETVICGAISAPVRQELVARGVTVIGFVAGELDEVVKAFIGGGLPSPALSMPGCCGRQRRLRGRRGSGGGRGNGRGRQRRR